jgi:hypothetical protein
VAGRDGRVWLAIPEVGYAVVLDMNGAVYKEFGGGIPLPGWMQGGGVTAIAAGSDGRVYMAHGPAAFAGPTIGCYEDWDQSVWTASFPLGSTIHDVILDSENRIYVCYLHAEDPANYSYRWKCLNPNDGSTIYTEVDTGVPDYLCKNYLGGELAIGDDGRLVLLHEGGFLGIYGKLEVIDTGFALDPSKPEPIKKKKSMKRAQ